MLISYTHYPTPLQLRQQLLCVKGTHGASFLLPPNSFLNSSVSTLTRVSSLFNHCSLLMEAFDQMRRCHFANHKNSSPLRWQGPVPNWQKPRIVGCVTGNNLTDRHCNGRGAYMRTLRTRLYRTVPTMSGCIMKLSRQAYLPISRIPCFATPSFRFSLKQPRYHMRN